MAFSTPILFLIFNRPETTSIVFERIREQKPKYLYVAADGPRHNRPGEIIKTEESRKIATTIDWDCEVKTLFRDENLGCRQAVSKAITWFFEQVEMGIILEDDCLPSNSFFEFCEQMLIRYKNDDRIFAINGNNFGYSQNESSYSFTKFMNVWGWATWRRSAQMVDYELKIWIAIKNKYRYIQSKIEPFVLNSHKQWIENWIMYFDKVAQNKLDTWDFQWIFTQISNRKYSIIPSQNLIKNIGFEATATHTTFLSHPAANISFSEMEFPLVHSLRIKSDKIYEERFVKNICYMIPSKKSITNRIKTKIQNVLKKLSVKIIPELNILIRNKRALENILHFSDNTKLSKKAKIDEPSRIYNTEIGDYTYISVNSRISETSVGKFCSIGPNFLCGWGIHPTDGISTSPMFYSNLNQNGYTYVREPKIKEREPIRIGNDVFIGMNVTILDGVKIGNGAVIGAGSVVTFDIPDYAIVGGVPAKIIKFRFDEPTIKKLLAIKWWDLPESKLHLIENHFFDIEKFINIIESEK